jgi:retron-type reverse transcriptase
VSPKSKMERREMRQTETILGLLCERGRKGLPIERLYRLLYNPDLYLKAYGKIYRNKGAMTAGIDGKTADGMSEELMGTIIQALKTGQFRWQPARRTYIPKRNGATRIL